MSIVEKIRASVTAATGLQCHYQSAEQLNRIADNASMPCAMFILLDQTQLVSDNGNMRERAQIAMFFADMTDFDFAAAENEAIIQEQKGNAVRWLGALRRSKELRVVQENGAQRFYDDYDALLTGYALNITIEEVRGECING